MEKYKGSIRKIILSAVCIAGILLGTATSVSANAGTVSVSLRDLQLADSDKTGVNVMIYQVGTVDGEGEPVIDAEYGIPEYPQTGEKSADTAAKLASAVSGNPLRKSVTDQDGYAEFQEVEPGVYLVCFEEDNAYGKVTPILIHLPYYLEVNGQMEGPVYDVDIIPKASPNESTDTSEPDDGSESEDKEPEKETEVPKDKESEKETEVPKDDTPVEETVSKEEDDIFVEEAVSTGSEADTGDSSYLIFWVVLMLMAAGSIRYVRTGRGVYNE